MGKTILIALAALIIFYVVFLKLARGKTGE